MDHMQRRAAIFARAGFPQLNIIESDLTPLDDDEMDMYACAMRREGITLYDDYMRCKKNFEVSRVIDLCKTVQEKGEVLNFEQDDGHKRLKDSLSSLLYSVESMEEDDQKDGDAPTAAIPLLAAIPGALGAAGSAIGPLIAGLGSVAGIAAAAPTLFKGVVKIAGGLKKGIPLARKLLGPLVRGAGTLIRAAPGAIQTVTDIAGAGTQALQAGTQVIQAGTQALGSAQQGVRQLRGTVNTIRGRPAQVVQTVPVVQPAQVITTTG